MLSETIIKNGIYTYLYRKNGIVHSFGTRHPAGKPTDLFTEYRPPPKKTEGGNDDKTAATAPSRSENNEKST